MSTVKLQSSDNEIFEVDIAVAKKSMTIKTMLEDLGIAEGEIVPLPNVNKKILAEIIKWAVVHKDDPEKADTEDDFDKDIPEWDKTFIENLQMGGNEEALYDLILAANYLDIKDLMSSACKAVANTLKGKKAHEIRQIFGIKNDLEPEHEDDEPSHESPAVDGSSVANEPPAADESSAADEPPAVNES